MWYSDNGDWGFNCPKCGQMNQFDQKLKKLVCTNKKCGYVVNIDNSNIDDCELAEIGAKLSIYQRKRNIE